MGTAIIYATGMTKHTKQVADYMARQLKADIFNLKDITRIDMKDYDTVIFGTGVHAGKPYKPVREFLEANRQALAGKRLVLFIECMYNGEKGDAQRDRIAEELGIPEAVYFNSKGDEMNEAGLPKAVDEFLARLRSPWSSGRWLSSS